MMTDKEHFDAARELIRHEDGLVNNRVTWLLVLQGFLINAFVGGMGLFEKLDTRHHNEITSGLVLICVLGIASSLTAHNVVLNAFSQMERVKAWWDKSGQKEKFPPIAGAFPAGGYYWLFSAGRMPFFFVAAWCAALLLMILSK